MKDDTSSSLDLFALLRRFSAFYLLKANISSFEIEEKHLLKEFHWKSGQVPRRLIIFWEYLAFIEKVWISPFHLCLHSMIIKGDCWIGSFSSSDRFSRRASSRSIQMISAWSSESDSHDRTAALSSQAVTQSWTPSWFPWQHSLGKTRSWTPSSIYRSFPYNSPVFESAPPARRDRFCFREAS